MEHDWIVPTVGGIACIVVAIGILVEGNLFGIIYFLPAILSFMFARVIYRMNKNLKQG